MQTRQPIGTRFLSGVLRDCLPYWAITYTPADRIAAIQVIDQAMINGVITEAEAACLTVDVWRHTWNPVR